MSINNSGLQINFCSPIFYILVVFFNFGRANTNKNPFTEPLHKLKLGSYLVYLLM